MNELANASMNPPALKMGRITKSNDFESIVKKVIGLQLATNLPIGIENRCKPKSLLRPLMQKLCF